MINKIILYYRLVRVYNKVLYVWVTNLTNLKIYYHFLEALDLKNTPFKMFARESWHYKDLRMAGIDPDVIYQNVYNLKYRGLLKDVSPGRFKLTQSGSVWARGAISRYFPRRYPIWDKNGD